MKKLLLFLIFLIFTNSSFSQVNSVRLFPSGVYYNSITAAYNDILAASPISQAYIIEIQSIYDGSTETRPIQLTEVSGASTSNSITIRPAVGATGISISDSIFATGIINLNGADYLIFDGRPGGVGTSRELTIINGSISLTVGTSCIRLLNDATNNIIRYCNFKNSGKDGNSGTGAVQFATTTGTLGNSNNYVTHNFFSDNDADPTILPNYNVASNGNTSTGSGLNSNNVVSNNILTNFFNRAVSLFGLNGNGWRIDSNKIYRNTSKTLGPTNCISVLTAIEFTIYGNEIGGQTFLDSFYLPSNLQFTGIVSTNGGTGFISKNIINNVRVNSTTAATLIHAGGTSSNMTISQNSLLNAVQRSSGELRGIVLTTGTITVDSNSISSLSCQSATVTNNNVRGIFGSGTAANYTIRHNGISNLSTSGSSTTFNSTNVNPLNGIFVGIANSTNISNNNIYYLSAFNTGAVNTNAFAIGTTNSVTSEIYNNRISYVTNYSTGASSRMGGILNINTTGTQNIYNNLISLGNDLGPPFTNSVTMYGISHFNASPQVGTLNIYYNSIFISGNVSAGNDSSFAFFRERNTPVNLRNNILANIRKGGTGNHYAVGLINNPTNYTASNNSLYTSNSSTVGLYLTDTYNFANWVSNSGETSSINTNPLYHGVDNLKLLPNTPCYAAGTPVVGITTDYYGVTRNVTLPTIGAVEVTDPLTPLAQNTVNDPIAGDSVAILPIASQGGLSMYFTSIPGAPSSYVTAQYYNSGRTGSFFGVTNISNYFWTIASDLNFFDASIRFYFNNIPSNGVLTPSTLKLMHRTGPEATWVQWSESLTNRFPNYIEITGVTGFSEFALGGDIDNPLPVELSSFSSVITGKDVELKWTTTSELNNSGFEIERALISENISYSKIGFISGAGNSNEIKNYSFKDRNLSKGNYKYRLKQIDFNGNFSYFNLNNDVNIGVPAQFELSQNYPNPFNPVTKINFSLPFDTKVNLIIYDITGKEVAKLINNEFKPADYYSVDFNGSNLSSGVYFYTVIAGDFKATKKMMLIK